MTWGLTGVSVTRGGRLVLDGATLDVAPGGIVAVVGGDGSGKSSLLAVLAGLLAPTAGQVGTATRSRLGFLPASSGVYPDLTAAENLRFAATVHRMGSAAADERIRALLAITGLTAAAGRLGARLSGGMRQKLGVAMALVHQPDLLILDEPTTGVDPVSRADLWWLIAREAARCAAVVLSTTYLDEAERAGEVVVLDHGRTVLQGAPAGIVAAVPGQIRAADSRPSGPYAWRRGRSWRVWHPAGGDGEVIRPDLQDAVVVAALREAEEAGDE
ncbi:ABC transporter ATP-binding protein [Actinoplanes sp. LDG1-06]|uniref:ABC transporter ATP-binding protein n=1 Tax=Paractinoplanes ovalisporus TaxID=2810368 RepID=A0ABS2A930_9ACTN|nr:ABC transporter ATP-binding protein [Actinoplanes ovalisporus]MBM2616338.1 ABC transporter ATP-binding protein [Actinoplanes ovalisporus]